MSRYDSRPCSKCSKFPITISASSDTSSHMFCDSPEHWANEPVSKNVVKFEFKTPVSNSVPVPNAPQKPSSTDDKSRRLATPKKLDFSQTVHKINKKAKCQYYSCSKYIKIPKARYSYSKSNRTRSK